MIEKLQNKYQSNKSLDFPPISETKTGVDCILNIETCPNCGEDMIDGRCNDSKICGYGHGDDYHSKKVKLNELGVVNYHINEAKKIEQANKRAKEEAEKNKLVEAKTLNLESFQVYINKCIINENNADLFILKGKEDIRFSVTFKIIENESGKIVTSIKINNIEGLNKSKIYIELKKYAIGILSDYKFNKYIISE